MRYYLIKGKRFLVVYVETISVFFMELPISFNGMVTMKNKFRSKQILLETKMFLSSVVYATDTAKVFDRLQQNLLQSHEKITVYLKLSSNVKSKCLCSIILTVYFDNRIQSESISYMLKHVF